MRSNLYAFFFISVTLFVSACGRHNGLNSDAPCPIKSPVCVHACCPLGASQDDFFVDHTVYFLASNRETKFADWVAYVVKVGNMGARTRSRIWARDPDMPAAFTLSPSDYKGANAALKVDRGHQAPLAAFSNTPGWQYTNYLSNITPQKSDLNQGAWKKLEDAVRKLAKTRGSVFVVTGTLYEESMPHLPRAHLSHRIPSGYWKVVAILDHNAVHLSAFVMPQRAPRKSHYCRFLVDLSSIENRTHLNVFPLSNITGSLNAPLGCTAS